MIVTNLEAGLAKRLCERLYCARGQAENPWKDHLAADRTSCRAIEAKRETRDPGDRPIGPLWRVCCGEREALEVEEERANSGRFPALK